MIIPYTSSNCKLGECVRWGRGDGVVISEWYCEGGAKPDGLVILRNQSQTLLSIRIPTAVFISVIVYPPTLQFVTNSFFLKNARAYCSFLHLLGYTCK